MEFNPSLESLDAALSRITGRGKSDLSLTNAIFYCDWLADNPRAIIDLKLEPVMIHYLKRRSYLKALECLASNRADAETE